MANSQLAKVTAPNITEVDFAAKLQESFETINENFKKIASLPFLQGAQGDSFRTIQYLIFDEHGDITQKGALLLNSIFGISCAEGQSFDTVKNQVNAKAHPISAISAIDSLRNNSDFVNNILYFYGVIDEVGEVTVEYTGQYYYFIDKRTISLSGFQSNPEIKALLPGFVDYSGFYQYVNDEQGERFEKMSILPSLYYDEKNNDICWMFNGQETGISAVGVSGSNGVSATLEIVGVTGNRGTGTSKIVKIARAGKWNTFEEGAISPIGGPVIVCIFDNPADNSADDNPDDNPTDNGNMSAFAFGQTEKNERDETIAVWDNSMIFSDFLNGNRIYEYLMHLGDNSINGWSRGLWIPTRTGEKLDQNVHMLYNQTEDKSQNLVLKMTESPVSTTASNLEKPKKFILNDYQLTAQVNNVNNVQIGIPIGSIVMWAGPGNTPPEGWLLCNGATCKRSDYENLYNVIGMKYGGNKSTGEFNVPNLQSRFPLGASSEYERGTSDGEKEVALTVEEMPPHSHELREILYSNSSGDKDWKGVNFNDGNTGGIDNFALKKGVTGARFPKTENVGGEEIFNNNILGKPGKPELKVKAHNNMPPYLVVNFIIKYK